jgi:DNA primase
MIDTTHVGLLALMSKDISLKRVASTSGGEYAGPCPFCGGTDRFRVWPHADKPGYWCRQCGRHGDAIQYLRDLHGLSFEQACAELGLAESHNQQKPPGTRRPVPRPNTSLLGREWQALTDQRWQQAGHDFVSRSMETLHSAKGEAGLAYLHQRSLTDLTIEQAGLGYNPSPLNQRWGTVETELPQGIVIPWIEHRPNEALPNGDQLWKVNIRRMGGEKPKYQMAKGSANGLYGISSLQLGDTVIMVEGEFCALSLRQAVPDTVTPVATGSVSGSRLYRWIARLALADKIILAFDADEPGDKAAQWWQSAFPHTAVRLRPTRHDVNDMLTAGDNIADWLAHALQ